MQTVQQSSSKPTFINHEAIANPEGATSPLSFLSIQKENPRLTSLFVDERILSSYEDRSEQEIVLDILYRMKKNDFSLTLVDCVCMLCEALGIETDVFYRNCGKNVREAIKQDAIQNRLVQTKGIVKNVSLDDIF